MPASTSAPTRTSAAKGASAAKGTAASKGTSAAKGTSASRNRRSTVLLTISLVTGLVTHGWHISRYPLYLTDEGIYVQQAWSVLRQGQLSPYTYFYDHAPGGWLTMAAWASILPGQFQTFGNEIGTMRVLMLLAHVASTGLLFGIVRRVSGSAAGAFLAAFIFNVSPLAIYYQRQVLLDNLMVFWLLLTVYLLVRGEARVLTAVLAGSAFGLAMVTKENAVFVAPGVAYLMYKRAKGLRGRRFMTSLWWFTLLVPVGVYALFAQLKNELVPSGMSFDLNSPPSDHVSLLYTVWWQLNRSGPEGRAYFMGLLENSWLFKDRYLFLVGCLAVLGTCWLWSRDRRARAGYLGVALLALGYGFYLARGSALLDFYVTPMIPLFAMNVGVLFGHIATRLTKPATATLTCGVLAAAMLVPGGYFLKYNTEGELTTADAYHLNVTAMQEQQIDYVRTNIPTDARLVIDDDIWTALHDREPYFTRAHSHFKAASDPDVRDKLFRSDPQNIDYVVMSNKMREAMERNNGDGREDWIFAAVDQGEKIWELHQGDIQLAVYKVQKGG